MKFRFKFFAIALTIFAVNGEKVDNNVLIVGGETAKEGEIPWQVYVQIRSPSGGGFMCGGTIYNQYNVITAAHCVFKDRKVVQPSLVTIFAGSLKARAGLKVVADRITPHQNYDEVSSNNDICVIRLSKPLSLNHPNVKALRLAPKGFQPKGSCLTSGWGSTKKMNSPTSDVLLKVSIPIVDNSKCNDDPNQFICAGAKGKDSCTGDSGGPLACVNNKQWVLAGVVSHGPECGTAAGSYTRITTQLSWIGRVTAQK